MASVEERRGNGLGGNRSSLAESISILSGSDLTRIQDESILRYVAKYSRNISSRRKAISELIKMNRVDILEYLAFTSDFDETKKLAILGLSRLSCIDALKRVIRSGDDRLIPTACSGLAKNIDVAIRRGDSEALEMISKFSRSQRQRKEAYVWLKKMSVIKKIWDIEKRANHNSTHRPA
ncbi:MAG: hypothetical protein ABIG39_00830 [Candidatus Micrarchaeota archaeon]